MIIFDIDGSGEMEPLSDGLIIYRWITGVRGDDLITGAVEGDATRTTASEIEGYLQGIHHHFDADGDGRIGVPDALLIFRYSFGFTGDTLISGCISAGAIRQTAEEIEAYLDKFMA